MLEMLENGRGVTIWINLSYERNVSDAFFVQVIRIDVEEQNIFDFKQ